MLRNAVGAAWAGFLSASAPTSTLEHIIFTGTSVVEPEPDFLAGAGAGEKKPATACCYVI